MSKFLGRYSLIHVCPDTLLGSVNAALAQEMQDQAPGTILSLQLQQNPALTLSSEIAFYSHLPDFLSSEPEVTLRQSTSHYDLKNNFLASNKKLSVFHLSAASAFDSQSYSKIQKDRIIVFSLFVKSQ